jgi:hypothetical protein
MLHQDALDLLVLEEVPLGRHLPFQRDHTLEGEQDVPGQGQHADACQHGRQEGQNDEEEAAPRP